jgi:hypothetical protein
MGMKTIEMVGKLIGPKKLCILRKHISQECKNKVVL